MKILIVARHYPPTVSGGARRPHGLTSGLRALGCEVMVVAPRLPDEERGVAVAHVNPEPSTKPASAPSLRDRARELLLIPDPDIRWARRAALTAVESVAKAGFSPDWVLTTAPPESILDAGARLKSATGARWIADFRDSWLERPLRLNRKAPVRRWREAVWARWMLAKADLITAVDEEIASELSKLAPHGRIRVIEQFADTVSESEGAALAPGRVHVVHTGSFALSDPDRRIEPALAAFERACAQRPELMLHLAGRLTDEEVALVSASPARDAVMVHGVIDPAEARRLQAGADFLLVVAAPGTAAIPGKVFEYRASHRPVVAIGAGPWRRAAGIGDHDTVAVLTGGVTPPNASGAATSLDAAERLLALMEEVAAQNEDRA